MYVDDQKVSGLRDVARPREFLKHFRGHFGRKRLREITYGDLISYGDKRFRIQTQYKRQRTISSWNREAAVLRRIFNIARQRGWIIRNPFHCGDPLSIASAGRQRERILTAAEEQRLLEACDSHPYRKPLKPLLIFLIDTGCRKGEALKLRWGSVCFASRTVTLEATTTKRLKARQVMMTHTVFRELASLWEASSKEPDATVFGISSNVRRSFASACEIAGINHGGFDGLTLHSLRHTAGTRLVQGGMSPQLAGKLLGHTQVNTTYRYYLTADGETMAQAASILEAFQTRNLQDEHRRGASETIN